MSSPSDVSGSDRSRPSSTASDRRKVSTECQREFGTRGAEPAPAERSSRKFGPPHHLGRALIRGGAGIVLFVGGCGLCGLRNPRGSPIIDGAPRQPPTPADTDLANRIHQLGQLDPEDRNAILHILDGLIAKNRVRNALQDAS